MTKDVLVSIAGLRYEADDEEAIEIISRGEYYLKNGKHYIVYEELSEENTNMVTKCTLKIAKDKVELIKNGLIDSHMIFEMNRNNQTQYSTPYGDLTIGVTLTSMKLWESEEKIVADLKYALDINYENFTECDLKISVTSS